MIDEAVPRSTWDETVASRAMELAERSTRPTGSTGMTLAPLAKTRTPDAIGYRYVSAALDHVTGSVSVTVRGPEPDAPADIAAAQELGAELWSLAVTRELDDLILDLRTNYRRAGHLGLPYGR